VSRGANFQELAIKGERGNRCGLNGESSPYPKGRTERFLPWKILISLIVSPLEHRLPETAMAGLNAEMLQRQRRTRLKQPDNSLKKGGRG